MSTTTTDHRNASTLVIAALGVVFGDIGTSPIYALRECFDETHGVLPTATNVIGVLSLIVWSLLLIVCVKYVMFVMRADNRGEGGILSLLALVTGGGQPARRQRWLLMLGLFGAALLYGDGMITPAISVLSAAEGLEVATPIFAPAVVPLTVVILVVLFAVQRLGTSRIGRMFGPVTLVWFVALAVLGLRGILQQPHVLRALNPLHGVSFLAHNGSEAFIVLGAVFLAVTGAEALYADMGHFGLRPIRIGWFAIVLPALLLNYFGQGALLLGNPGARSHPFYLLAPQWALIPLVMLATAATVIASQALITGSFSLTMQAIQLGLLPRMEIRHTSSDERGQIYMPMVNWALMIACVGLVLGFESSSRLAAAYGIAVTLTMLITTLLFHQAAQKLWQWSQWKASLVCAVFLVLETAFLCANGLKILHGGWFPLLVAAVLCLVMTTWRAGRGALRERLAPSMLPWDVFLEDLKQHSPKRVKGTAVFLVGNPDGVPLALLHNLKHNKVLHERVVVLHMHAHEVPYIEASERTSLESLAPDVHRVTGHFGFMEEPNVVSVLVGCSAHGLELKPEAITFFLSRETIIQGRSPKIPFWRARLFAFMSRNAQTSAAFFALPPNRVVELGMQIEL